MLQPPPKAQCPRRPRQFASGLRHSAAGVFLAFPGRPQAVYRKIAEPARCRLRSTGCLL